jgi:hypothetical protein
MAEPLRTPPSLLEHESMRTRNRTATASKRPSVGDLGRARDESLRASQGRTGRRELSLLTNLANQYT